MSSITAKEQSVADGEQSVTDGECDILIIGAGAVGAAIARELSKYELDVLVVDKNSDVGGDASKSNSAIIHTGYDATPDTLESQLVVAANPMFDRLVLELDVPYKRIGAILPAFTDEQFAVLPELRRKAFLNRVYDVETLSAAELLQMEPELNPAVKGGLYIPREHIIDPFNYVVALCENAYNNGVRFLLNTRVTDIVVEEKRIMHVDSSAGNIKAGWVINAAGLFCDEIAAMVGKADYTVNPRKGQFFILDKDAGIEINHIILPIPTKLTKGKLVSPTVHGNILVGPTAEDLTDKEDHSTTDEGLDGIERDIRLMTPNLNLQSSITQYAGLRPNRNPEGLRVDKYDDIINYINLSGIRSTGLTASAALGRYVTEMLFDMGLQARFNPDFDPIRKAIPSFRDMIDSERADMIKKDSRWGNVVCRCEYVTEGEIIEAIRRPIPAKSIDALKRRLRAGMGRCQGGFCMPRVLEILCRELRASASDIEKGKKGSWLVAGKVKGENT